jgi:hypothetical protein
VAVLENLTLHQGDVIAGIGALAFDFDFGNVDKTRATFGLCSTLWVILGGQNMFFWRDGRPGLHAVCVLIRFGCQIATLFPELRKGRGLHHFSVLAPTLESIASDAPDAFEYMC